MYQFIGISLILALFMFNMSSCTTEDELQAVPVDLVDNEMNDLVSRTDVPDGPDNFGHVGYYTNLTCIAPDYGPNLTFEEFFDNYEQCECFTQQWLANCNSNWSPIGQHCERVTRPEVPYGAFCGN